MNGYSDIDKRVNAFRSDLADIALSNLITSPQFVEPILRQCIRGTVPLFLEPHSDASQVSQIRYGEFVDVFETRKDGFAWIQNRTDRYVGYVKFENTFSEEISDLSNRVIALRTFVYPQANLKTTPIDELTLGSYVKPMRQDGDFLELASGGFVFAKHVMPASHAVAPDYVFTAGMMLGAPYLWGGRTPKGIDCSGLVQLALDMAGLDAPRDSDQQREALGKPLPCHWRDMA